MLRNETGDKTKRDKKLGLSRSLAWIQEKNFEDKFEVVRVIGCVRSRMLLLYHRCAPFFSRKALHIGGAPCAPHAPSKNDFFETE